MVSPVESPLIPFPVGLGIPTSPPPKYSSGINIEVVETPIAGRGGLDCDCKLDVGQAEPPRRLGRRARQKANRKEARLRRAVEECMVDNDRRGGRGGRGLVPFEPVTPAGPSGGLFTFGKVQYKGGTSRDSAWRLRQRVLGKEWLVNVIIVGRKEGVEDRKTGPLLHW